MRRDLFVLGLLVLTSQANMALAQTYPSRHIRVIVAQAAGSSIDTIGRIVTPKLSEMFGQQLVNDNRGGAGGTIGAEIASRAAPDGYTLLVGGASMMIISTFSYKKLGFDSLKDFDPVSLIANTDAVLVVNPAVAAKNVKELIALAKAQPGKLNMASGGVGSSSHLAGVMFASLAGIDTVHVRYKGGGPLVASPGGRGESVGSRPARGVFGAYQGGPPSRARYLIQVPLAPDA